LRQGKPRQPVILYPVYFDAARTRKEGRRVPKSIAIQGPDVQMITKAVSSSGYVPIPEPGHHHPKTWHKADGRVLVNCNDTKTIVVVKVAQKLSKMKK